MVAEKVPKYFKIRRSDLVFIPECVNDESVAPQDANGAGRTHRLAACVKGAARAGCGAGAAVSVVVRCPQQ